MLLIRLLFINILLFNSLADNPKVNTIFISPVRIPVLLSANFGELRIDHFHSGLDIKTQGVIGKEVVSAADGYIYRISVSPGGFGKALYVKHQSGYSTVYGHLDKFSQEIEEYVKGQQYEKKSYLITLFPDRDRFVVRQGDIIAYSGNSGSSGGPHLHFEIRKSDNEIPVNPLLFGFGPEDTLQPVIEKVVIYPANSNTVINNNNSAKKISVYGSRGKYYIPSDNEIRISGLAGFGIKTYDLLNDSHNKCAVYTIELKIDSISIFSYVMNGFSFNESRYINSHIDYETYMRDKIYIERAYILPNNKLRAYKDIRNKGIFNFNDDRKHYAEITVTDAYNNKSSLSFNIKSDSSIKEKAEEIPDKNLTIMPFNKSNKFSSENMAIEIPEGALYDTLCFSFRKCEGTRDMLSDLYHIHNKFTPLHKECKLSIKPISVPPGKKAKMVIVHLGDDLKKSALYSSGNTI
jgi:hypothetical protein